MERFDCCDCPSDWKPIYEAMASIYASYAWKCYGELEYHNQAVLCVWNKEFVRYLTFKKITRLKMCTYIPLAILQLWLTGVS